MKNISILIVEDEFITSDLIKDELLRMGYQVSGQARSAEEALHILGKNDTDVCMLDINIHGDMDGIELAQQVRKLHRMPIIFLTAYNDKKTIERAAQQMPSAYLIKPFKNSEIYAALEIAIQTFQEQITSETENGQPRVETSSEGLQETLFVKKDDYFSKIQADDILFVKSSMKYLEIYTEESKYLVRKTFLQLLEMLPKSKFIQPHRSYLVNLSHIDKVGSMHLLINGNEIPISSSKKEEIYQHFNLLK
ncbi:response regulator [bacterium SCSIO 12741]|nr:response regulator [bacterium SCSIO 12741]